jgi:alpha-galactosidase
MADEVQGSRTVSFDGALLVEVGISAQGELFFRSFGRREGDPSAGCDVVSHPLLHLQGEQAIGRYFADQGAKHHSSLPGKDLKYGSHREIRNGKGRHVEWRLGHDGLEAILHWQFFDGIPVLRAQVEIVNHGDQPHTLESIAPIVLSGLYGGPDRTRWGEDCILHLPHNGWCAEARWVSLPLADHGLGWARANTSHRLLVSNSGTWSTKEHLPMACLEDRAAGRTWFWQIESSGPWAWELSDANHGPYLIPGLLLEADHNWSRTLQSGERFLSLPVAVGVVDGGFDEAIGALTQYRRKIRRPHPDNEALPVIFNDYMNCLWAKPTTAKERPMIAAAAKAGCEIYVMDAGWYSKDGESWWSTIGEWQPSPDRFEGGLKAMIGEIRNAGMIPGLWLEIESMGVDCPLAKTWPDECFFRRHGKRIICRGRLQLDFRHPVVLAHADGTVDRMIRDYGVGYIKMDYNLDAGSGTEVAADSVGDGLLRHTRAYLDWLGRVLDRHPGLVIENCGSGGLRMDYALLSQHSIQSSSDQEDCRLTARIAALGAAGVAPEQLAVWAYPKAADPPGAVAMNLVNALLGRIHLSGELAQLAPEHFALVERAIHLYKDFRAEIPCALPWWPLGMPKHGDSAFAAGLRSAKFALLAVWNLDDQEQDLDVPLHNTPWHQACAIYPDAAREQMAIRDGNLRVHLAPGPSARLLRLCGNRPGEDMNTA